MAVSSSSQQNKKYYDYGYEKRNKSRVNEPEEIVGSVKRAALIVTIVYRFCRKLLPSSRQSPSDPIKNARYDRTDMI